MNIVTARALLSIRPAREEGKSTPSYIPRYFYQAARSLRNWW